MTSHPTLILFVRYRTDIRRADCDGKMASSLRRMNEGYVRLSWNSKNSPELGEVFGIAEWRPNLRRSFPWPPKGANSRAKTVLSGLAPASIACALGRTMMSCHAASRMASTVMVRRSTRGPLEQAGSRHGELM